MVDMSTYLHSGDASTIVNYVLLASELLNVDLSFIHPVSQKNLNKYEQVLGGRHCRVFTHELRHWLPKMYWITIFGKPYIELFGRKRLMSAPGHLVKEISDDLIFVQLVEDGQKVALNPEVLSQAQKEFAGHVGVDAFYQEDRKYDFLSAGPEPKVFQAPLFDF